MPAINPGLRWILIVVGLLAGNVIAVVVLITAAGPADADRVLPDYYERAAHFDDEIAADEASAALGWKVDATIAGGMLEIRMVDAHGAPLAGVHVEVRGYHCAHAGEPVTLAPVEAAPGVYRAPLAAIPGVWELTVRSAQGHASHVARIEVVAT
jgi:nitrogen fixation protein FixH